MSKSTPGPWSCEIRYFGYQICIPSGHSLFTWKPAGKFNPLISKIDSEQLHNGFLVAAAPDLLEIAKAYRNLLRTMAHTDGEVQTFQHIESVINRAEGNES